VYVKSDVFAMSYRVLVCNLVGFIRVVYFLECIIIIIIIIINVIKKEPKKILKYYDLIIEIQRMWNLKAK
jgi:hypothetical protein